jgi:MEDS: MEthanogen/methylotroph, DcmR Sensory domain
MSAYAPVHSVHFYDTNQALIDRLCGIVSSGLNIGNAVLIVATQDHRDQLVDALEQNGVTVATHIREERFVMCDAKEMLSRFMVGPKPDTALFRSSMGKLLADAKKSAQRKEQGLVVFGEMVAVLWDEGNKAGALAVERLWNNILNETAFHLHCAYPRALFAEDEAGMTNICDSHSHVVGALSRPH